MKFLLKFAELKPEFRFAGAVIVSGAITMALVEQGNYLKALGNTPIFNSVFG